MAPLTSCWCWWPPGRRGDRFENGTVLAGKPAFVGPAPPPSPPSLPRAPTIISTTVTVAVAADPTSTDRASERASDTVVAVGGDTAATAEQLEATRRRRQRRRRRTRDGEGKGSNSRSVGRSSRREGSEWSDGRRKRARRRTSGRASEQEGLLSGPGVPSCTSHCQLHNETTSKAEAATSPHTDSAYEVMCDGRIVFPPQIQNITER